MLQKGNYSPRHKVKPVLYANYYQLLKDLARSLGYNLLLNGSLARDLDLVAIPWTDDPVEPFKMVQALAKVLKGTVPREAKDAYYSVLPGGRQSYVIDLNRSYGQELESGTFADVQYYIDICITPFKTSK